MDLLARGLAGNPAGGAGSAGGFSVQGHRVFHGDQGKAGLHVAKKRRVQGVAFVRQKALRNLYTRGAERCHALSRHQRVRVRAAHKDRADTGINESLGAGRLLSVVAAGLQRHVENRVFGRVPAALTVFERGSFRVEAAVDRMPAFA